MAQYKIEVTELAQELRKSRQYISEIINDGRPARSQYLKVIEKTVEAMNLAKGKS